MWSIQAKEKCKVKIYGNIWGLYNDVPSLFQIRTQLRFIHNDYFISYGVYGVSRYTKFIFCCVINAVTIYNGLYGLIYDPSNLFDEIILYIPKQFQKVVANFWITSWLIKARYKWLLSISYTVPYAIHAIGHCDSMKKSLFRVVGYKYLRRKDCNKTTKKACLIESL